MGRSDEMKQRGKLLAETKPGRYTPGTPEYTAFMEFLPDHINFAKKTVKGLKALVVKKHHAYIKHNCLYIEHDNRTLTDISVSNGAKYPFNRINTDRSDAAKAMRNAIIGQILEFKQATDACAVKCPRCDKDLDCSAHVDHANVAFITLMDDFVKEHGSPRLVDAGDMGKKIADKQYKKEWQRYHTEKATLRYMCPFCNRSNQHHRVKK